MGLGSSRDQLLQAAEVLCAVAAQNDIDTFMSHFPKTYRGELD